jgi:iron complex outermembrane receptor protein
MTLAARQPWRFEGRNLMVKRFALLLAAVSSISMASTALAQDGPSTGAAQQADEGIDSDNGEIIVTARRRDESLRDVPQTVNVVTAAQVEKLNLRNFTDIQSVVPGLQLTAASAFSNTATVRGIAFDPVASGNNPSVEFYLNDSPITAGFLFQSTYDFGQFELQRGPQGTLRGRASPSGSIAVTTRRPDLSEVGAVVNGTISSLDARKIDGAFNLPIIKDVLAIRVAGVIDNNKGNRIHSLSEDVNPQFSKDIFNRTQSLRASARFEPTDWAAFNFVYQTMHTEGHTYPQLVSESLVNPAAAAATTPIIRPFDRLGTDEQGTYTRQDYDVFNFHADIRFAGQKLSYVGSYETSDFGILGAGDAGNFFSPPRIVLTRRSGTDIVGLDQCSHNEETSQQAILTNGGYIQCTHSASKRKSHELRLASEDRIGGIFDYVVGAFYDHNNNPSDLTVETPILFAAPTPTSANPGLINLTGILRRGQTTEKSAFGNVTAHLLEDKLELSGGLRYINYKDQSFLYQTSASGTLVPCDGNTAIAQRCTVTSNAQKTHATVYMASAKYQITPDIMIYGLTGSSWRAGPRVVGIFSLGPNRGGQTARELSFLNLPPERSKSYEIGAKTSFLDGRGTFNISAYYQKFRNYPFFGPQVFYISTNATGVESVAAANNPGGSGFVSPVPATVKGVELEASYRIMHRWTIGLNAAYADGKIKNATVACTDLNGDGVPDLNPARPTVAQLQAAVGAGQTLSQCSGVNGRSAVTPKFSANAQTEVDFDVGDTTDGFVRGLYSFYGKTVASQANLLDDVGSYGLLNLYAGIRDKDGQWELSVFAKNITRERDILTLAGSPATTSYQVGATASTFVSEYRSLTVTTPREFGVSFRVAFGSR